MAGQSRWIAGVVLLLLALLTACEMAAGPATEDGGTAGEVAGRPSGSASATPLADSTAEIAESPSPTSPSSLTTTVPTVTPLEMTPEAPLSTVISESPDGEWRAETVLFPGSSGKLHVRFTIYQTAGERRWLIVDEERLDGLGFPSPLVLRWLPEQQALFYTESAVPGGCPSSPYHMGLYRVALTTGESQAVTDIEGYLALSPAGERLAYWPGGATKEQLPPDWELVLRDMESREEQAVPFALQEDEQLVNFLWSPDATRLLVVTASGGCSEQRRDVSLIDLATGEKRVLVQASESPLFALEWTESDMALLRSDQGRRVHLNIQNGEISEP